jgi:hypothetical protein
MFGGAQTAGTSAGAGSSSTDTGANAQRPDADYVFGDVFEEVCCLHNH